MSPSELPAEGSLVSLLKLRSWGDWHCAGGLKRKLFMQPPPPSLAQILPRPTRVSHSLKLIIINVEEKTFEITCFI